MSVLELSALVAVALVVVAPALVFIGMDGVRDEGRTVRQLFLRFAAAAAFSGVVAGLATLRLSESPPVPLLVATANATLVGAPAYLWAGMRQLRGRSVSPGWIAASAVAGAFLTSAVVSAILGGAADGFALRLLLVAVSAAAVTAESLTRPARSVPGFVVTGAVFAIYSVYSVGRVIAYFTLGAPSPVFQALFSPLTASIISAPLVVVLCGAVWWSDHSLGARAARIDAMTAAVRDMLARHGVITVYDILIPDLSVIRAAFGSAAARAVDEAAARAVRAALPEALHRSTIGRHLAALVERERVGDLPEIIKTATAHAVPGLDYREAIDVQVTRAVAYSRADLARLWPGIDAGPPSARPHPPAEEFAGAH